MWLLVFFFLLTDEFEIRDLKDCLSIEQEEKNELNKKLQRVEKECEYLMHSSLWYIV